VKYSNSLSAFQGWPPELPSLACPPRKGIKVSFHLSFLGILHVISSFLLLYPSSRKEAIAKKQSKEERQY
jgi:hypothetical protein